MNFRCIAMDSAVADRFRRSATDDAGNRIVRWDIRQGHWVFLSVLPEPARVERL